MSDLEAFRTILREELAPLRAQLLAIEGLVRLQPDLSFLHPSPLAHQVIPALRKAAA